jgi:activating signal cointegrator 1
MPKVIKAITLYQPYASLIIAGAKRFETRTWGSDYTGLLVIHAGKTLEVDSGNRVFMYHLLASGIGDPRKLPLGAALGVVWKGKCFRAASVIPYIDEREQIFGGFKGDDRVAWELENPVAFEQPIPMKGSQGLWDYKLPIPDAVLEQFAHVI